MARPQLLGKRCVNSIRKSLKGTAASLKLKLQNLQKSALDWLD
jgi:hypothetical protein